MSDDRNHIQFPLDDGGWIRITPVGPQTLRIRFNNAGEFAEPPLIRYGILSNPESPASWSTKDTVGQYIFRSGQTFLEVSKVNGRFAWGDGENRERIRTSGGLQITPDGFQIRFGLRESEKFYGFGDAGQPSLQRRGSAVSVQMRVKHSFAPVPFLMSSEGWALLLNTTWDTTFDVGSSNENEMVVTGSQQLLDFYLFHGGNYPELLDHYTDVSGKPALLPVWAYGLTFLTSKPSNEHNVTEAALKFRQLGIPCDLIDIAPDWTEREGDRSDEKRWHPERYPTLASADPRQRRFSFIHTLRKHGFKLSLYLLGCDSDLTAGGEHSSGANADDSWYAHLRKFVDDGISAFVLSRGILSDVEAGRTWSNGMSSDELRNLLPLLLGKQIYDGFRTQTGKRPMLFGPLGYTGIQQFTAIASRDSANGALETTYMLNCCLSGFIHTSTNMPEMFTPEGIHAGFLQAWSRLGRVSVHLHHPAFLVDSMQKLFTKYARLRYSLMPYLYSAAHVAACTGLPIVRPMPLMFQHDPVCDELSQQYMLGDSLLVAVYTNKVYLPEGSWINYWTGEHHEGGTWLTCENLEDVGGPLFVRGGSIIPQLPHMDYIGQLKAERIILHLYPCSRKSGEFTLYEDDGETMCYLDGQIAVTSIFCETDETRTTVRIARRCGTYEGMPFRRHYEFIVHAKTKPVAITSEGRRWAERPRRSMTGAPGNWYYDRLASTVLLYAEESTASDQEIRIDFTWHPQEDTRTPEPSRDSSLSESVKQIHYDEVVVAALELGDLSGAERAIKAWWKAGFNEAAADGDWRLPLLKGSMLMIRLAEKRGWTAHEVFGVNLEALYTIKDMPSSAQGVNLLLQFARQLLQYNPNKQPETPLHPAVREALDIIKREIDGDLSLQRLAGRIGVHPFHLSRLFKQEIGSTFSDYILQQRMNDAKKWIESGKRVYEAAELTGFKDVKYFSRAFRKYWGVPPKTLR
ncbi:helix-turn-helix domain-containing protein [Paenibacillus oceani]|uniref:Helix-turn-helix domain-containing protein n=1 Tax=Paenibacillus oceani TaxID=2772510 RepID=A0A927CA17_9BACL|nr:helix-turn-helix domain-containing protein [Paenibacillus oceani]MBD2862868.1 helix-turn-helix domain-containing protein [Paenibacillus oceani]